MHIKQVVIDGFKSYAQRTEVNNFDPLFNAITGLNGSGKSNILDSICFVLGISNLQQVSLKVLLIFILHAAYMISNFKVNLKVMLSLLQYSKYIILLLSTVYCKIELNDILQSYQAHFHLVSFETFSYYYPPFSK